MELPIGRTHEHGVLHLWDEQPGRARGDLAHNRPSRSSDKRIEPDQHHYPIATTSLLVRGKGIELLGFVRFFQRRSGTGASPERREITAEVGVRMKLKAQMQIRKPPLP